MWEYDAIANSFINGWRQHVCSNKFCSVIQTHDLTGSELYGYMHHTNKHINTGKTCKISIVRERYKDKFPCGRGINTAMGEAC